jgi:Predicted membrane protein (DUF2232)
MMQILLIGVAAGAASALLFASVSSGSLLSVSLFYLAPLPIMIAAVGWSHVAALVASAVAAASLAAVFGSFLLLAFVLGIGLPAWWLGYLALLGRPGVSPGTLEWYPVGRLVVWAALLGTAEVVAVVPNFGMDAESFRAGLRGAFAHILQIETAGPTERPPTAPGLADASALLDFLVVTIPPTAAVIATITNVANLWLAGRVVRISGRLRRPWPHLTAMTFPSLAPALLLLAFAGVFLPLAIGFAPHWLGAREALALIEHPGLVGIVSGVLAASLLMAYAMLGFAIIHASTVGVGGRGAILTGVYLVVIVFGWPLLAVALIGLIDSKLDIRARVARRHVPPARRT